MKLNILIACEYSATVREAFTKLGHNAMSCDLLPSEIPGRHYQGDVRDVINEGWDLMIAHPPCTYITNSGVCWLYNKDGSKNEKRWEELSNATDFFNQLLNADIPYIAIENPIPHKHAGLIKYSQTIQPYEFGHPESKRTCLWLKNLPLLNETKDVKHIWKALPKKEAQRIHYASPGLDRWKVRSKTYQGIADAMASQWSEYIINQQKLAA